MSVARIATELCGNCLYCGWWKISVQILEVLYLNMQFIEGLSNLKKYKLEKFYSEIFQSS